MPVTHVTLYDQRRIIFSEHLFNVVSHSLVARYVRSVLEHVVVPHAYRLHIAYDPIHLQRVVFGKMGAGAISTRFGCDIIRTDTQKVTTGIG